MRRIARSSAGKLDALLRTAPLNVSGVIGCLDQGLDKYVHVSGMIQIKSCSADSDA